MKFKGILSQTLRAFGNIGGILAEERS
jgi:hypothetical protein